MVNKLLVASTTRNKMQPEKSLGLGWDSLKFSFHSLLLLSMLSHQTFALALSRITQIFDRAIVISDKVWRTSTLFASPFWFLRNTVALPITNKKTAWTSDRTRRLPATAINGHQYNYNFGLLWITGSAILVVTQTHNIAGEEISGFERKAFTRQNFPDSIVFGFKDPTLDSGFKISGGMSKPRWFYFGFVLLCLLKRQNQSGTKTFRIHHESGTISSSVNLV